MWQNTDNGLYGCITEEDGFAASSKVENVLPAPSTMTAANWCFLYKAAATRI